MIMNTNVTAIGLVSGGLDSALAVALLRKQGIGVLGLHYVNGFSPGALKREIHGAGSREDWLRERSLALERSLGIPVEAVDVSEEYLDLLVSPDHGYGANVNPCIDCRIFMLRKARKRLAPEGPRFIFTGEVLGQRPMSQHRAAMNTVERESGLAGLLLRPLCAKLLPATIVEREGWVDRAGLLDIQGRSRKRQIELAREFGLSGYTQPAGGCALTDENYARKFKDFMEHRGDRMITRGEAILLSVGRHLRISPRIKVVVGREEAENKYIEAHFGGHWLATTVDHPGPTVLIAGDPSGTEIETAAAITARYSDGKREESVRVSVKKGDEERIVSVAPLDDGELERYRL
jgi:hypothetical protein